MVAVSFISVPAMAETLAAKQTAHNFIQQERQFLGSILTNVQTRIQMLNLQTQLLQGQIDKLIEERTQQEASRKRAFEARKRDQLEKAKKAEEAKLKAEKEAKEKSAVTPKPKEAPPEKKPSEVPKGK